MLGSVSPYAAKSRLYVAYRWLCTVQRHPAGGRVGTTLLACAMLVGAGRRGWLAEVIMRLPWGMHKCC